MMKEGWSAARLGACIKQNQTSRAGRGLCGHAGWAHLSGCSHHQHVRDLQDVDGSRCLSGSCKRAVRRLVVVDRHGGSDSHSRGGQPSPHPTFWLPLGRSWGLPNPLRKSVNGRASTRGGLLTFLAFQRYAARPQAVFLGRLATLY